MCVSVGGAVRCTDMYENVASPSPRCICPGSRLVRALFIQGGNMEIESNGMMANPLYKYTLYYYQLGFISVTDWRLECCDFTMRLENYDGISCGQSDDKC